MRRKNYVLVVLMSALCVMFLASDSAAWSWYTYEVGITSPESGEKFVTHDVIHIRWYALILGEIPPPQTIHYMIRLNGARLTYDYYDNFVDLGSGAFKALGSFDYRVPGNGYSKNPNSILQVFTGKDDCPDCYSLLAPYVIIGIKTWYDPLPRPKEPSPVPNAFEESTWGKIKALYK